MWRGLLIAFLLSFGPAVSNSFARFAYALLLPAMREDLQWSWSQAGAINTVNAFGYLLGALLTGHPRHPIPLKKGMLVSVETETSASLVASLRFALSSKLAGELA